MHYCNCFGTHGQFDSDQDFHEYGIEGCCRKFPNSMIVLQDKLTAVSKYINEREMCKNPDMSPYVVSHAETMAFLNGWDAALKHGR